MTHTSRAAFFLGLISAFCFTSLSAQTYSATLVRFHTNAGDIDVQLLPGSAPATVSNFLSYMDSGAYNNSLIHRLAKNFVFQGGGYTYDGTTVTTIPTRAPVINEFHLSNTRGTIAMAKVGSDPNSATDQWFFNLVDNSANLDNQNGGFTVFGRVANATSLAVMDKIAALPVDSFNPPFDQLPVFDTAQPASGKNLVLVSSITGLPASTNIGIFYNSRFYLDSNGSGGYDASDKNFFYVQQQPGDIAIYGDWNGDGHTKVGLYRDGFWILDYNGNGVYDPPADKFYAFGGPASQGFTPVVGDWNGDGKSKIGYYKGGFWVLDYNGNGTYDGTGAGQDRFIALGGNPNETPLVGDWNFDGRSKVGVFSNGTFTMDYDGDGTYTAADKNFLYLSYTAGDRPLTGDWNGDGRTKVGIYRNGFWILDFNGNGIYDYPIDKFYGFGGNSGEVPLVGDWNGDGRSKIGILLRGFWALDYNGTGSFEGTGPGQDRFIGFGGNPGEQPVIGRW
jgi:cyclophilin family peptidyl-prolyl cis-trans isomerase